MALKDFDDTNPRTRDKNWKEDIPLVDMPKLDEWYAYRIIGGIFTYAQHWIEFTNKQGEKKRYPVDCANWDQEKEAATKKGGCPACEVGIRASVRYMMNVIDREAQQRGDSDPVRALDIPPTVMRQIIDLKKLNVVKGKTFYINHPKFGCDVFLEKQRSQKRGGVEWQVQKGDRSPLGEDEKELELVEFDEYWQDPDVHKCREDLKRHGYFDDDSSSDAKMPKKGSKKSGPDLDDDDDDDFAPPKRSKKSRKPEVVDDDFDEDEEDDEDLPPAPPKKRRKKKKRRPEPEEDMDLDDEDEEDDEDLPPAPPKKRRKKKRPVPPPDLDEDDDDDDFDFDDDD